MTSTDQCSMLWRVAGRSVRGSSHERLGVPNQDALHWLPQEDLSRVVFLAVSDGHGSAKSFRSEIGSHIAVEVLTEGMHQFSETATAQSLPLPEIQQIAEESLPASLVRQWRERVEAHLAENPFTTAERERLLGQNGEAALAAVRRNTFLAYGATALGLMVTEQFILYLQLGDGDILTVDTDSQVTRPIPKDERLFADQTTSLCSPDAWLDFRARFDTDLTSLPSLILLSTDGYANSFQEESGFLQVGSDLNKMIHEQSWEIVTNNLEDWLMEASRLGSGDDITVGLVALLSDSRNRSSDEQSLPSTSSLKRSSLSFLPWRSV